MFSNSSNYCCTTIFEEQDHVLTLRSLEHHVLPFGNNNDQLGKTGEVGGGGGVAVNRAVESMFNTCSYIL